MADRNDQAYNAPNLPNNKLIEAQLDPPWGIPSTAQDQAASHPVQARVTSNQSQRQVRAPLTIAEQPGLQPESSSAGQRPAPALRPYLVDETLRDFITFIRRETGYTGRITEQEARETSWRMMRNSQPEWDAAGNFINKAPSEDILAPFRNTAYNQPARDDAKVSWSPGEPLAVETLLYLAPLGCATPLSTMTFTEQMMWLDLVTGKDTWKGHKLPKRNFADAAAVKLREDGSIEVQNREAVRTAVLVPVEDENVLDGREENSRFFRIGGRGGRYYWIRWEVLNGGQESSIT